CGDRLRRQATDADRRPETRGRRWLPAACYTSELCPMEYALPSPPMTRVSITVSLPDALPMWRRLANARSALEGVGSPLGWLWATMIPVALQSSASRKMREGKAMTLFTAPMANRLRDLRSPRRAKPVQPPPALGAPRAPDQPLA